MGIRRGSRAEGANSDEFAGVSAPRGRILTNSPGLILVKRS